MAFLARISSGVAHDYQREVTADKRGHGRVIPIDIARAGEKSGKAMRESSEFGVNALGAILSWIDVERIVEGDPDRKYAQRNALIFKLHYIDGFEAGEIARFPVFELTKSGVDTILARLRKRIQE